jgi:hypothetical protein
MGLHHLTDFGEQLGADQVAVRVVDGLEMIEVDEHERKFVAVALRAVDLRLQNEIQVPRVVQAGAIVGDGELVDALHVARVFQGDGGEIRQGFEQRQVALLKSLPAHAVDQLDDAEAMFAEAHGTATMERVSILVFSSTLEKKRVSLLTSGTITASLVLGHPSGNALPHL